MRTIEPEEYRVFIPTHSLPGKIDPGKELLTIAAGYEKEAEMVLETRVTWRVEIDLLQDVNVLIFTPVKEPGA